MFGQERSLCYVIREFDGNFTLLVDKIILTRLRNVFYKILLYKARKLDGRLRVFFFFFFTKCTMPIVVSAKERFRIFFLIPVIFQLQIVVVFETFLYLYKNSIWAMELDHNLLHQRLETIIFL